MRIGDVELLLANGLETKRAHHRVEEDLQEVQVIFVSFLHHLNPLNGDLVLLAFLLTFVYGQLSNFLKTEDT